MNKNLKRISAVFCMAGVLGLGGCNIRFEDETNSAAYPDNIPIIATSDVGSTTSTAESTATEPAFDTESSEQAPPVSSSDPSETPSTEESSQQEETSAPEETAPSEEPSLPEETSAPETPIPETPAPETPAPETPAPETPVPETPAPEPSAPETPADIETAGMVLLLPEGGGYRGMYCFDGTPHQAEIYAGYVNQFKEQAGAGINVYSMVVPTACEFYCPAKYINSLGITSEKEFIESEGRALVNVTQVNVYPVFDAHKDEYITLKTDHHWAPLGAYYCAQEFARVAGVPFADLSQYDVYTEHDYIGSHYFYSDNSPKIGDHPEDFVYYIPKAGYTALEYTPDDNDLVSGTPVNIAWTGDLGYYRYCPDDRVKRVIKTEVKNGRKLMIIKDSYGDALAPMLLSSFEEIYFTDLRFIGCNAADFAKKFGVTDVLFVTNVMVTKECGGYLYDILS